MSEMGMTTDRLIVIGRGWLIADASLADLVRQGSGGWVQARSPEPGRLGRLLQGAGVAVEDRGDGWPARYPWKRPSWD
jgi:ABC-2 type transport system ATP-binding protein